MNQRKLIVWDLDDVLNNFAEASLQVWSERFSPAHVSFREVRSNPPFKELGLSLEEYLGFLDRFQGEIDSRLVPHPDVRRWFGSNGARFHHIILTARPCGTMASAAAWAFSRFGIWIRGFHCVPGRRREDDVFPRFDDSKADVLRRMGNVDYFIDDSRENVEAACAMGIRGLLFPQPWNPDAPSVPELLAELEKSVAPRLPPPDPEIAGRPFWRG